LTQNTVGILFGVKLLCIGIRVHYGVTRKPGETFWWLVFKIASTSYIR